MAQPQKYFYTVLFLDDFYPERAEAKVSEEWKRQTELPELKTYEVTKDSNSVDLKWIDENTLFVRHNLPLPLTLEMWNNENKPIFYCPVLKEGIDSISVGQVVIESSRSLTLHFNEEVPPPADGETFKLSLKTLPAMDTTSDRLRKYNESAADSKNVARALDELVRADQTGVAIVFRRHSLDAHFDLLAEFDENYLHSLAESTDLKYLTYMSKFRNVKWLTRYTSNLQDVLDDINNKYYEIRFSWTDEKHHWYQDDPFGYQHKVGHYPYPNPWHGPRGRW